MEAVAAHALVVEGARHVVGVRRMTAVESRVEAGHLRHLRVDLRASRIGARLCGWCSGASSATVSRARMAASMRTGRS